MEMENANRMNHVKQTSNVNRAGDVKLWRYVNPSISLKTLSGKVRHGMVKSEKSKAEYVMKGHGRISIHAILSILLSVT